MSNEPSANGRMLPTFLVLGAMKAGSTSAFRWIEQHPDVTTLPEAKKGPHYFDKNWERGIEWYSEFFPPLSDRPSSGRFHTGEGTASYLYYPRVPERTRQTIPGVKMIALLREPTSRTYSHYQHNVRQGREKLSFEDALAAEPERLEGELERVLSDESYFSKNLFHFGYLARSRYAEQIERWLAVFPREQMLFVRSEDMYSKSEEIYREILDFLGLPLISLPKFDPYNPSGGYAKIRPETKEWLMTYFEPLNQRLASLVGSAGTW